MPNKQCALNYHVYLLYSRDHAEYTKNSRLTEDESKCNENIVQMEINFVLRKNGGHRPCSLGGRLIVVVSEC